MDIQLLSHYKEAYLEDRYPAQHPDPYFREIHQKMLNLIHNLRANPPHYLVWAYTSHLDLTLTNEDTAGIGVGIDCIGGDYCISYLVPNNAPWPNAIMSGRTALVDQARMMICIALGILFPNVYGGSQIIE